MALAILRLHCKEMPKKKKKKLKLLVYVDGWTDQKSLLHEQKLQKPLEIPIFQFASRRYIFTFSFLAKKVTTKI